MFELQYHIITGDKAIVAVAEESWEFSFQAVRTWRGNTTGLWLSYSTLFDIFFQLRASDFDIFNLCDIISDVHTQTPFAYRCQLILDTYGMMTMI